ncbi:DUF2085 domain-containing protein [Chondromyces apiculatus]|uniref:DUF2085 domain-containing protein n=1 Tax=Chondromyces apiculatus DSM 436 TaxID=1192034 RepID=A0A017T018_9BACT|nr:DUF2085 domain-containing protein [Chondromyces apiculatus]EYF02205.1 Hypothetical protein CAP_7416 [Chondromyces apiculatus DSM 436]
MSAQRPPALPADGAPHLTPEEAHAARSATSALLRACFLFIGVLPWGIALARAWLDLGVVGTLLDSTFAPMCHRLPERSLTLAGTLMPLCSRCAGIFAGFAVGAILARPHLRMSTWRVLLSIAAALMVADVITQDLGLRPLWHQSRLATGFLLGYGMVVAFVTHVGPGRPDR